MELAKHTLRRNDDDIAKQAVQWTPQGHRNRRLPKNTWNRDLEKEMGTAGFRYSWRKMEAAAQDSYTKWRDRENLFAKKHITIYYRK